MAESADHRNEYELVLMLDPEAPEERRDEIVTNARQRIEGRGALKAEKTWGVRKLAYEIRRRTEADYRFFRFETDSPLLDELNHNLKITDGVLRFRLFKVDPESPVIEPPPPVALASSAPSRGPGGPRRDSRGSGAPPPAPTAEPVEAPPAAPEEAPAAVEEPVAPAPAEEPPPAEAPASPEAPPAEG